MININRWKLVVGSIVVLSLLVACVSERERRVQTLRFDSNWPNIRAAAQNEVARRERDTQWSATAYFNAHEHTNGVWYVVAAGAYPLNTWGDNIDILVKDSGEIAGYAPRWSKHPR
jgi:hypothetical protein